MYEHKRTMLGQYAGWYTPATLSIDLLSNKDKILSDKLQYSFYLHECLHYWQSIATTYGFYYAEVSSIAVHRMLAFVEAARAGGVPLHCPFRTWGQLEGNRTIKEHVRAVCRHFDMISSHLDGLEGGTAFNASTENADEKIALGDWNSIQAYLERGLRTPSQEDVSRERLLDIPVGQMAPILVGNNGGMYALGAASLSECFAFACQLLWATETTEITAEILAENFEGMFSHPNYVIARQLFVDGFPEVPNIEANVWFFLPTLVDLALNGPLLPELRELWTRTRRGILRRIPRLNWRDVHPGFRYLQALKALKESQLLKSGAQPAQKIVEVICKQLKWPTPIETAKEILKVMSADKKHGPLAEFIDVDNVVGLDLYDYRLKCLNKICALRVESPDNVSSPTTDKAIQLLVHEFPPLLIRMHESFTPKEYSVAEWKYQVAAKMWEMTYSITKGLVEDPPLLQCVLGSGSI
jgi:hypothetical protein